MVTKSEKTRIQAMIQALQKRLSGDTEAALNVSLQQDDLDDLAKAVNALLNETGPTGAGPQKKQGAATANEQHYVQILDRMQESYFETDINGNFIFFNDRLTQALGYDADELPGMNFRKIIAPHCVKNVSDTFQRMLAAGEGIHALEWQVIKKDGSLLDVESSADVLRDAGGKPLGFYGISHDITQRKQTERKLQASEERYRHIIDSIEESYFEVDLKGNLLYFNDSSPRDLQYTQEEISSKKNYRQFTDEQNAQKVYNKFHQVYLTGQTVKGFDWQVFRKDGKVLDVESSVSLMRDEDGRPCGFRGITRDVSQRKETEKRLRLISENIRDVIWTRDFDLNFTYVSPSIYRMTGFTSEEVMSIHLKSYKTLGEYDHYLHELREKLDYAKAHPFEKGAPLIVETQIMRKDGALIWVENNISFNRDENGVPFEIIGVIRDITERKKVEETFKESEKLHRMIVENMQDSITLLDFDLNYIYQSPSEVRVTGWTAEEIRHISIKDQMPPESFAAAEKVLAEEFEREFSGQPLDPHRKRVMELQIYRKDGSLIWEETTASFYRDETGKAVGILLCQRDITDRKKAEQAFAESEKRYRMIVENMHDSIATLDMNLKLTYQSPSEIRLTGYTPEEVARLAPGDIMTPESRAHVRSILEAEFAREFSGDPVDPHHFVTLDVEVYHKDGHRLWQEVTASFNRDENGKPVEIMLVSRDITERKKMEAALKESERRYRMIVENMHDTIWTMDLDLHYTYQSPSEVRVTGYTPEEIMQPPIEKVISKATYERVTQLFAEELEKEFSGQPLDPHRSRTIEVEMIHKDGSTIWQEISASFNRDENGKPIEIMLVGRDITERKKVEEELRESEKRYRMIVENMQESIALIDLNLQYIYQSPSEIHISGYTPEEIIQIPSEKQFTPESFARGSQMLAEELELEFSGKPVDPHRSRTIELEYYRKDGSTVWLEVTASFQRDETGKPMGILMVSRDINERKKMEAALKESEKRYRMIVENMQDTISLLDLDLNYVYQSPSEIRVTGFTPEEVIQIPSEKQVTPASYERAVELFSEELAREFSGEPVDPHRSIVIELEAYRKDGSTVWIEETCTFQRDDNGKPIGILMAGRNITERKKAEQERDKLAAQLLQSQKMETVGRLAGGVAHDFNNMLNVILGYIDLAKMRLTMENPIYTDLLEIEKAATRSRDLTAQLLAFSRKQIISPKVVNLNALIAETQKTITRLIGEDIDLKFYPAGDLWAIKFDPVQIEQILINLAINARDAMHKGGKLVIETSNITVDSSFCDSHMEIVPGDYVRLTVSDTGSGIDRANLPYVFEPFFTTKEFGKGTGLGLATVYGIIKQNDGFISVYSEPGQGSTFKIYLPRTIEELIVAPRTPEAPVRSGSGTILLVEDDEMVLKMVSDMLEALGYMVIASESPVDALSLCQKGVTPIDLVITDVVMPQMSGKELRDKLIAFNPEMKILFMSGYTSNIIAQHGVLEEGMQFIQKPFSISLLAEKIRQMLAGR